MSELSKKKCIPCSGDTPRLSSNEITPLMEKVDAGWKLVDNQRITHVYSFSDFAQGLEFTNIVGAIAEEEGHHPDIYLSWGKVVIEIWTHKIDGLSESDFILAAKIDGLTK